MGGSIYKSIDGGETWSAGIKLGAATIIADVKVDTSGAQDVVLVATNAGLFRSLNGGATYGAVINGGVHWSLQRTSAGWIDALTSGGSAVFARAATAAGAWALDFTAGGIAPAGRMTLGVGAPGDAIVYAFAATAGSAAQKDLYRSIDGGATWTGARPRRPRRRSNPNEDQPDMNIMAGQAFYNQMLLVDPNDLSRNTVYIGGQLSSAKIDQWRRQLARPHQLARAVRAAVRARRSSCRCARDHQGQADPAVRR